MTLNLPQIHIDFIRLISRSKDVGQGWRKVNASMEEWVRKMHKERPALYETSIIEGLVMVRLTDEGSVLEKYLT